MATNAPDERGWQVGKPLAECLKHMLDNEITCDVIFEIQSAGNPLVKVSAHKMILQARSPVFEAMFSGAFVESDRDVIVTDIEPMAFKTMLKFMYTDEVTVTGANVVQTLYAANKYILEGLSQQCKEFLSKEMSVDNVCSILTDSLVYQDEDLVNTCMDLIAPNAKAVSKTEAFYSMSHDALLKVVRCDQLALGVEADLFEGCLEWGRREVRDPTNPSDEEIRKVLGECLYKIRFPYIPMQEFALKFGNTAVLTEREKNLLYNLILTKQEVYSTSLIALGFDVASRMMRYQRYSTSISKYYHCRDSSETEESFTFSADKAVQLRGFSVYGGRAGAEHDVIATVQSLSDTDFKYTTQGKIKSAGYGKPIPIYIKRTPIGADGVPSVHSG